MSLAFSLTYDAEKVFSRFAALGCIAPAIQTGKKLITVRCELDLGFAKR